MVYLSNGIIRVVHAVALALLAETAIGGSVGRCAFPRILFGVGCPRSPSGVPVAVAVVLGKVEVHELREFGLRVYARVLLLRVLEVGGRDCVPRGERAARLRLRPRPLRFRVGRNREQERLRGETTSLFYFLVLFLVLIPCYCPKNGTFISPNFGTIVSPVFGTFGSTVFGTF